MPSQIFTLVFISFLTASCGGNLNHEPPSTGVAGDGRLDEIVDFIRMENNLPALAAIMIHDGQVIEKSAKGYRSVNGNTLVTTNDKWHIGSNTKSMTALVAAVLVKNGFIRWDSSISEVYPELVGVMKSEYEDIRLDELLSHTSGLQSDPAEIPGIDLYDSDQRALRVQRQEVVEKILLLASNTHRGEFSYNNLGYVVAGSMLEKATGSDWESLMQNYLFATLQMLQSGFGAPDTHGNLSQPVGHAFASGKWMPVDPSSNKIASDNPPFFGPAGTAHASLGDMAAYLAVHLNGLKGEAVNTLLNSNEFEKLYTPPPGLSYALGWGLIDSETIHHTGSNTLWYSMMLVDAEENTAYFLVTNADDLDMRNSRTENALEKLLTYLRERSRAIRQENF